MWNWYFLSNSACISSIYGALNIDLVKYMYMYLVLLNYKPNRVNYFCTIQLIATISS